MRRVRPSSDVADATHGLQLLVAIADTGSFTAAGARVGLTPSAVSGALPVARKIYALYLPSRYLPPQVRAFVDLLVRDARNPRPTRAPRG